MQKAMIGAQLTCSRLIRDRGTNQYGDIAVHQSGNQWLGSLQALDRYEENCCRFQGTDILGLQYSLHGSDAITTLPCIS